MNEIISLFFIAVKIRISTKMSNTLLLRQIDYKSLLNISNTDYILNFKYHVHSANRKYTLLNFYKHAVGYRIEKSVT